MSRTTARQLHREPASSLRPLKPRLEKLLPGSPPENSIPRPDRIAAGVIFAGCVRQRSSRCMSRCRSRKNREWRGGSAHALLPSHPAALLFSLVFAATSWSPAVTNPPPLSPAPNLPHTLHPAL